MTMPIWILFAIFGYLSMAVSQLFDKALLNIAFKEAKSFVFFIGAMNVISLVLIPFGVHVTSVSDLIVALIGGAMFIVALIPFLSALQSDQASRVIPLVGGLVPLFSFAGEWLFLGGDFTRNQVYAFILLVCGSIVLTFSPGGTGRRSWLAIFKSVLGAFLFAVSFLLTSYVFRHMGFLNGFFWMRMGGIFVSLYLLFDHDVRSGVKTFFVEHSRKIQAAYFANQGLNAMGFVLQNYAISLASVSLVNALQGSQYLFIVIFVAIASRVKPNLLGEKVTLWFLIEKLTAIAFIVTGIALLAI